MDKTIVFFAPNLKRLLIHAMVAAIALLAPSAAFAQEEEVPGHRFAEVRVGFDGMARAEAARNLDIGSATTAIGVDDSRVLVRLRPAVEAGRDNAWRGRVEGQWYGIAGRQDSSDVTVYQAFLEGEIPGSGGRSRAKAGRQELVYGSAFLLGADGFHDGQSWDAFKVTARPADSFSIDLFGARYVTGNSGGIDGTLYGIHGTLAPAGPVTLELYTLRDSGGEGATHRGGRHEVTWSSGVRLTARAGESLTVEAEPVWQFGRKGMDGGGHMPIEAFGGHLDLAWRPPAARLPLEILAAAAFGSGDGSPGEGRFREFHNPNNDTPLVGDMNVIGDLSGLSAGGFAASGLRILTIGVAADLAPRLNLSLSGHHVRAGHAPAGFSREIGTEANLTATCAMGENVSIVISGNRFFTGGFFRDAVGSGKDIDYGYLQIQAAFGGKST